MIKPADGGRPACMQQAGVSLLEALVALAVMAVGAVSVVGMQASLRANADVSKQRSEAVRLAQEEIERWRGFSTFGIAPAGQVSWTDLATSVLPTEHVGSNVTFQRSVTVAARGETNDDPLSKSITVAVTWTDRTNQPQSVAMNTIIAGVSPELGGALSVPMTGTYLTAPRGRHPSIPPAAVDQSGGGTSRYQLPSAPSDTYWIFDNATGIVLQQCSGTPPSCTIDKAIPVYGFVRFSTGNSVPLPDDRSENPADSPISLHVQIAQTYPSPYTSNVVTCYHEYGSSFISYGCAVPVSLIDSKWKGRTEVAGIAIAASETDPVGYRVCRYTPVPAPCNHLGDDIYLPTATAPSCTGTTGTPKRKFVNEDFPSTYDLVATPLVNQNLLIIKAGFSTTAFQCPSDNPATLGVNGNTVAHQP